MTNEARRLPLDYVEVLNAAKGIVKDSVLYRRFIAHTPLDNDIAVWMADFVFDRIERAEAVLRSTLSQPQEWQPIETAPTDGTSVLVWTSDVGNEGLTEFASVCAYHPSGGFCTHELMVATHWMPLPTPPREGAQ